MLTLALIGLIGGLITGVSPCVLPLLPIIFFAGSTTADSAGDDAAGGGTAPLTRKRVKIGRPLRIIAGLVTSFSIITLFGTALLGALGLPDDFLLWVGLVVLVTVGLGLIVPSIGHLIEKPFYRLPKISNPDSGAFVFGLGLGTLYVPCAGPILAAIVVAGATGEIGWNTVVLTISFAIGAATPLLFFAAAGAKAAQRINQYRARARAFRIGGGVVLIALAVALAFDAPAALQKAIPNYTGGIEQRIADSKTVQGALTPMANDENRDLDKCTPGAAELAECGIAPRIKGTQEWFNTPGNEPVSLDDYRGKVVLLDFWAYSCINCQRDAPHIRAWYDQYADSGFQVIGIHSPEFAFEKNADNVRSAIAKEKLTYPIAQDNNLSTWTNYRNRYWPAKYLIDADGVVRAIKFGEGDYAGTEKKIRALLREANPDVDLPKAIDTKSDDGPRDPKTPETYLGWSRSTNYAGTPKIDNDDPADYEMPAGQPKDTYSLGGRWLVTTQYAEAIDQSTSWLSFTARNVFHVLAGEGTVTVSVPGQPKRTIKVSGTPNLYEIYSAKKSSSQTVTLTYSKGVQAYTFTFG